MKTHPNPPHTSSNHTMPLGHKLQNWTTLFANSTHKPRSVASRSHLCRTQSSASLNSISQDPLRCCSWRCYLWVLSVQSNTTVVGNREQRGETATSSFVAMVTQQTAPQLTSFVELPLPFYTCGWVLSVCTTCQVDRIDPIDWLIYWPVSPGGSVSSFCTNVNTKAILSVEPAVSNSSVSHFVGRVSGGAGQTQTETAHLKW